MECRLIDKIDAHEKSITSFILVDNQVWSSSKDHLIKLWNRKNTSQLIKSLSGSFFFSFIYFSLFK